MVDSHGKTGLRVFGKAENLASMRGKGKFNMVEES